MPVLQRGPVVSWHTAGNPGLERETVAIENCLGVEQLRIRLLRADNEPLQHRRVVFAPSYEELDRRVEGILARARKNPGLANLDSDLKLNKPQLAVEVDRDKVAAVGAEVDAIGRTLGTLLGGRQGTRFKREGKQYDVIVRLEDKDRVQPTDLTSIYVRARDGQLVQLSNLVQLKETVAPKELNHFNRLRDRKSVV